MKSFINYLFIFLVGGFGYCIIEILWRGRTHYSMFFAGGIILTIFYYINQQYNLSLFQKCIIGALIITLIELIFGVAFNIVLKEGVWDYSNLPLNLLGQICLPFSLLWLGLSAIIFSVLEKIKSPFI